MDENPEISSITLKKRQYETILCHYDPAYKFALSWKSSDESVAEIIHSATNIQIRAKAAGECVLTATAFDGTEKQITVTVE